MRKKSRPLKCDTCGTVYGSTWGPIKRGRYIVRGGTSSFHLCPGKLAGNVAINNAGHITRRAGISK